MHLMYKVLVDCMPEVHLRKLQALVHQCFNSELVSISMLRTYNYAIIAQLNGKFIGTLLARISKDEQQHEISKFCVAPHMRGTGVGAEMLAFLQNELPTKSSIILYVDAGKCHDRLVSFYERNGLLIAAKNETETMMASKLVAPMAPYKGNEF